MISVLVSTFYLENEILISYVSGCLKAMVTSVLVLSFYPDNEFLISYFSGHLRAMKHLL